MQQDEYTNVHLTALQTSLIQTHHHDPQEMMDATVESGKFEGWCKFTGPAEPSAAPGSSNESTRALLDWSPKHASFRSFMQGGATDVYLEL